ncbi:hypothetical protein EV196_106240 [Mariniflexile fucanivorans]|uniref:DUF4738 domain-containing protein n=1 Tax=Mariniflexile fucanivorans TaxID=264023 RepID=A0A4R1RGB4_9FLAO|nr:hypothetical protein [Mariniflexile fucanivorans]TCL65048.1 hypothetical protein EV196_106240 [Mariniflexile fucanivorans]
MKNLILFCVIIFGLMSCNGGKTKKDTLKTSVEKFKDSIGVLEIEAFIPEEYSEVKTDTILSNGFSIRIKTYTDMNRFVTCQYKIDETLTHIDKFRDWISEVTIKKNDVVIFDKTLDANFFLAYDKMIADSLPKAINSRVLINEDYPVDKNYVYLLGGFILPESEEIIYYNIKIDSKGTCSLEKIKDEY